MGKNSSITLLLSNRLKAPSRMETNPSERRRTSRRQIPITPHCQIYFKMARIRIFQIKINEKLRKNFMLLIN